MIESLLARYWASRNKQQKTGEGDEQSTKKNPEQSISSWNTSNLLQINATKFDLCEIVGYRNKSDIQKIKWMKTKSNPKLLTTRIKMKKPLKLNLKNLPKT